MLRTLCLLIILLLQVLLGAQPSRAEENTALRVGLEDFFPPFAMQDENGRHAGFDQDIAEALCRNMNRTCHYEIMPLDELIASLLKGDLDFFAAGMRIHPELLDAIAFSDSYFRSRSIYVGNPARVSITREGLKDKRIGVQQGTRHAAYCLEQWGDVAVVVEDHYREIVNELYSGTLDAIFVDGLAGYELLKHEDGMHLEVLSDPLTADAPVNYGRIAVRRNAGNLIDDINHALHDIRLNGEYHKINSKYFPFSLY